MNYYFITGSSRGIGKAVCESLLLNSNNKVYGISRNRAQFEGNFEQIGLDLSRTEDVRSFKFPEISTGEKIVLINNAGILGEVKPLGNMEINEVGEVFFVNTISPLILMNSFTRQFQKNPAEKLIINISSGAGRHAVESWSSYCGSKAALDMICEVFNLEQKRQPVEYRISAFSLAPGIVDTEMQNQIRNVDEKDFADKQRFVDYKKNNLLWSAEKVATFILKIIENPQIYPLGILDVRNMV